MISRDYALVGSTSRAAVWGSSVGDDEPKLVSTSENQWKHVVLEELILLIWLPSSGGQLRSLSERPALRAVALMSLSSIKDATVSTSSTVGARIADCWTKGDSIGELRDPRGCFTPEGKICVADTMNDRIQTFDLNGQPLSSFGERGNKLGQLSFQMCSTLAVTS